MLTLYAFGRVHPKVHGFTRDLRVLWGLEETGLPYRVRGLDHTGGELGSPEFRAISPFGQLPVIDDDGLILAESGAILLYLAKKAGRLIPGDAQGRAQVERWCFAALTTVEPPVLQVALDLYDPTGQRPALVRNTERQLTSLDRWLKDKPFVTGEDFTVADILLTTVLHYAHAARILDPYSHAQSYRQRCEARPLWAKVRREYEKRLGDEPGTVS